MMDPKQVSENLGKALNNFWTSAKEKTSAKLTTLQFNDNKVEQIANDSYAKSLAIATANKKQQAMNNTKSKDEHQANNDYNNNNELYAYKKSSLQVKDADKQNSFEKISTHQLSEELLLNVREDIVAGEGSNKVENKFLNNDDKKGSFFDREMNFPLIRISEEPGMNSKEFRRSAYELLEFVIDYNASIRTRQVLPSVEAGYLASRLPDSAPMHRESWSNIMDDIDKHIMPGMTHWHSPRFHAYFPTAQSYPSILADILSASLGCIGFNWANKNKIASPACTELEMKVMDWFVDMLGLPSNLKFSSPGAGGGVIHGTASEATLFAMLAAKSRTLTFLERLEIVETNTHSYSLAPSDQNPCLNSLYNQINNNKSLPNYLVKNGRPLAPVERIVAYASDMSHSSVERSAMLAGVKYKSISSNLNCQMTGKELRKQFDKDIANGLIPFYVVATLGTTSVCTFDDLESIGQVCEEYNVWLHVDAAYAGNSFICPEFRYLMKGIEYADSFDVNPHKWLLINFDCSLFYVKNSCLLVDAFNVDPVYLKHENQDKIPDFRHWQIPLGRRFRSLKAWFVVRLYGINGLQEYIRNHIKLAKYFEKLVDEDQRFTITHPTLMGLVCFRMNCSNKLNDILVKKLTDRKKIFLTPTKVRDQSILRFAVCAKTTNKDDIDFAWNEIKLCADLVLNTTNQQQAIDFKNKVSNTDAIEQTHFEAVNSIMLDKDTQQQQNLPSNNHYDQQEQSTKQNDINPTSELNKSSASNKRKIVEKDKVKKVNIVGLERAFTEVLTATGEDIHREGLKGTPLRAAKALEFFTSGYHADLHGIVNGALFDISHNELVVVKDIEVYSLCEHHLVPFFGKVWIACIPRGKVLGLSKFARIVEMFARRLQLQERLTRQIAEAVQEVLDATAVAVVMEARHMCMMMRGVHQTNSSTFTKCMLGDFLHNEQLRSEFLSMVKINI